MVRFPAPPLLRQPEPQVPTSGCKAACYCNLL
jgi:hypothetical protein